MSNYLEGYVRARQTMAEIERGQQVIGPATDQPDVRAPEQWFANLAATARRVLSARPSSVRSRLSGA